MLQFDLQFYEELTVARVKTVKFISGAFFWPTGQLVLSIDVDFWFKLNSDRSTTHPKFNPTRIQTHDLQITTVHFMSLRCSY